MATKRRFAVFYRRKREGKTNYKKRLALLLSRNPRLVIRPSLKNIAAQIVNYKEEGDKTELTSHSRELKKMGWGYNCGNIPSAYLTGFLIGTKAKKRGIRKAMLDIGLNPSVKHTRIYASVKGAIDAGLDVPCSEEVFPNDDRIKGKHIEEYAEKLGNSDKQFSRLVKEKADPKNIASIFNEVKKRIESG